MAEDRAAHGFNSGTFLDAYSRYNHIPMLSNSEKKIVFIVKATFKCLMTKILNDLIWKQIYVCVDKLVVNSGNIESHRQHLKEVFTMLRKYRIKLNPNKCTFNVTSEIYLKHHFPTPTYPQENEQATANNKTLLLTLKRRLGDLKFR